MAKKSEDTKWVIRSRISKNAQHNGKKKTELRIVENILHSKLKI